MMVLLDVLISFVDYLQLIPKILLILLLIVLALLSEERLLSKRSDMRDHAVFVLSFDLCLKPKNLVLKRRYFRLHILKLRPLVKI